MPRVFSDQIDQFKTPDDAFDALESRLSEYGQSGFVFWTFPRSAFDARNRFADFENLPVHATFRGPLYLKAAEVLYWKLEAFQKDPTLIASCLRNSPFTSADIRKTQKGKKLEFDVFSFLERFNIFEDHYFPCHTPARFQVLWTFRIGVNSEADEEYVDRMDSLAKSFMLAISDFYILQPYEPSNPELSVREFQCLSLIARGFSNEQIALELSITAHTAKFHVMNLMRKLKTNTRANTVAKAARSGWLTN